MKTAETTAAVSVPVATNTSSCTYMVGALVDMFTRIFQTPRLCTASYLSTEIAWILICTDSI